MKSLMTLTSFPPLSFSDDFEDIKLLQDAMRHIFQRAMAETDVEIQRIIKEVSLENKETQYLHEIIYFILLLY